MLDVSVREAVVGRWPAATGDLDRYATMLSAAGVERGLIGPREVPRLWQRHLANSAVVCELVPEGAVVVDVGSGAGLPGLPLALGRPDLRVILVEPLLRRSTFLSEAVSELGLDERVSVLRSRAEDLTSPLGDVVTARAVAPLERLAGWTLPIAAVGGILLAIKGDSAYDEAIRARAEITRLGGGEPEVLTCGADLLADPTRVIRISRLRPSSKRTTARGR